VEWALNSEGLRGLLTALWAAWLANGVAPHANGRFLSIARRRPDRRRSHRVAWTTLKARRRWPPSSCRGAARPHRLFDKQGALVARETAWGQRLTARGYVVLFPDSFGPRSVVSDCEGSVRPWVERSYDAYGALRYLQSQSFAIGERVRLIGWSQGGATVTFAIVPTNIARPTALPKGDFRAAVVFYPAWCWYLGVGWTIAVPFLLEIGALDDSTQALRRVARVQSAIDRGAPVQIKVGGTAWDK
jgi:hypothetical protein